MDDSNPGTITREAFDSLDQPAKVDYLRRNPQLAAAPGHYSNNQDPGTVPKGAGNLADQFRDASNRYQAETAAADVARRRANGRKV